MSGLPIDVWSEIVMKLERPEDVLRCALVCPESREAVQRVKSKFADKYLYMFGNGSIIKRDSACYCYIDFNDSLHGPWVRAGKTIKWFEMGQKRSPPMGAERLEPVTLENGMDVFNKATKLWLQRYQ
jgi:hypothetical protein